MCKKRTKQSVFSIDVVHKNSNIMFIDDGDSFTMTVLLLLLFFYFFYVCYFVYLLVLLVEHLACKMPLKLCPKVSLGTTS